MKAVKLGIIGTGIAAENLHWPALKQLKDKFEITAVCNHTEPKAKKFANLVGNVPYVLNYTDLLKRDDVEAVSIILPIELNLPVTGDVLKAGKHVLVEKPLALNMSQARAMLELSKHSQKVTMVGENFRYVILRDKLIRILSEHTIDHVRIVNWDIYHHIDHTKNRYAKTKWRINHKYDGGFITDSGVHYIALLRDVFGEMIGYRAWKDSLNRAVGELDSFSLQFQTEKGIHGLLNLFFTTHGIAENRLHILGTAGSLTVENNGIRLNKNGTQRILDEWEYDGGYRGQYEDFYEAITKGTPVRASFPESYRDLEIILQSLEAAGFR